MKKSRIIIPALAVMALSMGAAVTSTVAWFTANRNATATSNPITIINPEGNLLVQAAADIGTSNPSAGFVDAATIEYSKNFRDSSVDLIGGTDEVWTSQLSDDGNSVAGYRKLGSDFKDGVNYCAQTYTLTFKFDDKSKMPQGNYGVFLDGDKTASFISANDASEEGAHTAKALRVGFKSTEKTLILGPSVYSSLHVAALHKTYISDADSQDNPSVKTIPEVNIAKRARTTTYKTDNLLGHITVNAEGAVSEPLTVKVWTWFEGSDTTNVNNDATITADAEITLKFNVIKSV